MARTILPLRPLALQTPPERHAFTSRRFAWTAAAVLGVMIAAYALTFGWLSLQAYRSYQMHALDMGNMGQAAWNTIHGRPFFFTNMRLGYNIEAWKTTTRLSFHVEAIFPLISLVYLVHPGPESLLVLQTGALAVGAVPVFLLARDQLNSIALGVVFALAYLLYPTLQAMNLYEFHPVALAPPLLLAAFLFASRAQDLPFALCCLLAIGTKEEIGLVAALFGLYAALLQGRRRVGFSVAALGTVWSLAAALIVEHHYRSPGTVTYFHSRYNYLGHGVTGALSTVLHHPDVIARTVITWPKFGYLFRLLAPVGLLALLSPAALALGIPTLALNVLSTEPHMYSALGQDSAELIAVVFIAAIVGARLTLRLLDVWLAPSTARVVLVAYVLLAALWAQRVYGFAPGSANFSVPQIDSHQEIANRFVAMIPPGAPVSTQDQLDPHLSSRRYLYLFEDNGRLPPPPLLPAARHILLDASAPTYPLPSSQIHDRAMSYLRNPNWGVAAARDGLILLERGVQRKAIPAAFYSFMRASTARPAHSLHGETAGLGVIGYDLQRTDAANEHPPRVAYTIYVRPLRRARTDVQPIIFAVMNNQPVQCATDALGLAWYPTTRWRTGESYRIHMAPLQLQLASPSLGTANLYLGFHSFPMQTTTTCASMWSAHGRVWRLGSVAIGL